MLGRALSPGEEWLVFNFYIKSKVWLEQLHVCAGSSWCSGFCVETLVEVLPVQYQLCTGELCDGLLSSRPCRSSSEAVMKSLIDKQCYWQIHLSCVHTFCVALLPPCFSTGIFCSISDGRSLPLEHQSCFLLLLQQATSHSCLISCPLRPRNLAFHLVHHSESNNWVELPRFFSILLIQRPRATPHCEI